jgi:hypothetical protein
VVHEAGETSRAVVDALRSQPVMLVVVLICLMLVGLLYYQSKQRADEMVLISQNRAAVFKLLAECEPVKH